MSQPAALGHRSGDRRVRSLARRRLWLSNWDAQEILAYDLEGHREVMTRVPTTIPFSIDWLPDGQLLVVAGPGQRARMTGVGEHRQAARLR